jgi:hypothetical protein
MPDEIVLRLMVERPDLASATVDATTLIESIAAYGHAAELHINPYWKIATYYEIAVTLRGENSKSNLRSVATALAPEWHWLSQNAIWDYRKHGVFKIQSLAQSVRWAEIIVDEKGEKSK